MTYQEAMKAAEALRQAEQPEAKSKQRGATKEQLAYRAQRFGVVVDSVGRVTYLGKRPVTP